MKNANPSVDPANYDSLTGAFREIFSKLMSNTDGMLPAQVIAYNAGPPAQVQVKPLIKIITTTGETLSRPVIADLPVFQLGGGGFLINFPLQPGDLGWIVANDRDISLFLQSYEESPPNTFRKKSFSDALFIPNVLTNYTIAGEDSANMVLQNLEGTVKLSLGTSQIKIQAPTIILDGNITINGTITPSTPPLLVVGEFHVSGDITASGDITPHIPP